MPIHFERTANGENPTLGQPTNGATSSLSLLLRSELHTSTFYFKYVLQLPLQSTYCCMLCAYNWDILLHLSLRLLSLHCQSAVIGLCSLGGSVDVTYLRRGLWVRIARKACWLAYCKMPADIVGHPATFGILHLTYYVLGHTKSFSGIFKKFRTS